MDQGQISEHLKVSFYGSSMNICEFWLSLASITHLLIIISVQQYANEKKIPVQRQFSTQGKSSLMF